MERKRRTTSPKEVSVSHYTEEPVFYGRFRKNIHVSDRSTKLALIRTNNCFCIELDLPNNASLKEESERDIRWARIRSVPVAELSQPFRIGYLIRRGTDSGRGRGAVYRPSAG